MGWNEDYKSSTVYCNGVRLYVWYWAVNGPTVHFQGDYKLDGPIEQRRRYIYGENEIIRINWTSDAFTTTNGMWKKQGANLGLCGEELGNNLWSMAWWFIWYMNITGTEMGTLNSQWYNSSHFQVSSEKHEICLWGLPMLRLKCEPSSSTRHTFWTNDLRYTSSFLTSIAGSHEHILVLIYTSDIAQFRSKVFPADFNKMQNKNTIFCLICKYLYIFFHWAVCPFQTSLVWNRPCLEKLTAKEYN
jgi:hypothetical protein